MFVWLCVFICVHAESCRVGGYVCLITNTSPIQIFVPIQKSLTFWLNGLLTLSCQPPLLPIAHTQRTTTNCRQGLDKQSRWLCAGVKCHRHQHYHCHYNHRRRSQESIHGSLKWPLLRRLAICVAIYRQLHGIIVVTSLSASSPQPPSSLSSSASPSFFPQMKSVECTYTFLGNLQMATTIIPTSKSRHYHYHCNEKVNK